MTWFLIVWPGHLKTALLTLVWPCNDENSKKIGVALTLTRKSRLFWLILDFESKEAGSKPSTIEDGDLLSYVSKAQFYKTSDLPVLG